MDQLLNTEQSVGKSIIKEFENFKKDGRERKNNREYFSKRINTIEILFKKFCDNNDSIDEINTDHDITFRDKVNDAYTRYHAALHDGMKPFIDQNIDDHIMST